MEAGGPCVEKVGVRQLGVENELFKVRDSGGMDEQVWGQNSNILVVKGAVIIVRAAREVVCLIGGSRLIDKLKIEFRHFQEVVCNAAADFLRVAVVLQVRVVCEDTDFMRGANQEMAPSE
jgi:hypothetical protein